MHPKSRCVVFVGTTYFGCNVKYAWAALHAQADSGACRPGSCLTTPSRSGPWVTGLGGRCLPWAGHANWTPEHLHTALSAAVVVTSDHFLNPNPYAAALLAGARHVQLWHGVSIKEIGLRNLARRPRAGAAPRACAGHLRPLCPLLGTAAAGEAEWRRWFAFERYAPIGYPRNDVLYREPTASDLAGCDRDTYARAQRHAGTRQARDPVRTDLPRRPPRMGAAGRAGPAGAGRGPGRRPAGGQPAPGGKPADPQAAALMPGVAFVAPRTDLYPLLGQVSALVTDYSSVMFDYLHVDRPVLLFRPDHEAYTQKSRKLFDDKLVTLPGPLFDDAAALAKALRRPDLGQTAAHAQARARCWHAVVRPPRRPRRRTPVRR
jgi:CDP-glycerol glycerophosphotransferase